MSIVDKDPRTVPFTVYFALAVLGAAAWAVQKGLRALRKRADAAHLIKHTLPTFATLLDCQFAENEGIHMADRIDAGFDRNGHAILFRELAYYLNGTPHPRTRSASVLFSSSLSGPKASLLLFK